MTDNMALVPVEAERSFLVRVATQAGLSPEDSAVLAEGLLEADLRGVSTHGAIRMPWIARGLLNGALNARPRPQVVRDHAAIAVYDADNAVGIVSGRAAMDLAIDRARTYGIGMVSHRNTNFTGMLAYHTLRAASQDMIGYFVNNGPAALPAWGGIVPMFGTNPFSVAVPAGGHPIVVDMASSVIARGVVRAAAAAGQPIPPGAALDQDGRPTTDAHAAMRGLMLPFAGHKGYSIAIINEIVSALLAGAVTSAHVSRAFLAEDAQALDGWGIGHTAIAINVAAFRDLADFKHDCDCLIDEIQASRTPPGEDPVRLPGERGWRLRERRLTEGIPFSTAALDTINNLGIELGVGVMLT